MAKTLKTLTVQTLDGTTFYVARRALTPQPRSFRVVTSSPKGDNEITQGVAKEIEQAAKKATTRTGTPKLRIGPATTRTALEAELQRLRDELARLKGGTS